jgi:quercetin dioxygenase-like cupin family protein
MEEGMRIGRSIATSLAVVLAVGAGLTMAVAQSPPPATQGAPGIKRTIVQKMDVPGTNLETIVAVVEIAPNFKAGRHSHPGNVTGYVSEGEFLITFDGQPQRQLKVGESVAILDGAIHDEGTGDKPAKLLAVYVVEKGKPLASPAK